MHAIKEIPTNILINKIKITLFELGFNERYVSFDYITYVITYFIKHEDSSYISYKTIINLIAERHNTTARTITQSIHKILNMCENFSNKNFDFFISKNQSLNKIIYIKNYFLNSVC
jgi:hypothetical protein